MDKFEVGEIAIVYHPGSWTHGKEALIVGPLEHGPINLKSTGEIVHDYHHSVVIDGIRVGHNGNQLCKRVQHLRKKRPPRDDLKVVRWDQCPWRPATINS